MNRKRTPIIPKLMRKNKLHIWKEFTVIDMVYAIASGLIAFLVAWGLNMLPTGARIIIGLIILMAMLSMLLPVGTWDVRVYNKVIDAFKFMASKKHFAYRPEERKEEIKEEEKEAVQKDEADKKKAKKEKSLEKLNKNSELKAKQKSVKTKPANADKKPKSANKKAAGKVDKSKELKAGALGKSFKKKTTVKKGDKKHASK